MTDKMEYCERCGTRITDGNAADPQWGGCDACNELGDYWEEADRIDNNKEEK